MRSQFRWWRVAPALLPGWRGWRSVLVLVALCTSCATPPQFEYLGVPDSESRILALESFGGEKVRVLVVKPSTMSRFDIFRKAGRVERIEEDNGYLYYCIRRTIPTDSANQPGQSIVILERYKVEMDHQVPE